jgi:hypothetical protein
MSLSATPFRLLGSGPIRDIDSEITGQPATRLTGLLIACCEYETIAMSNTGTDWRVY